MSMGDNHLPHWTWADLEAALDGFGPSGANDPVKAHLMRGLAEDAAQIPPRELLRQVLSAGWVMAQMGARVDASATGRRQEGAASGS